MTNGATPSAAEARETMKEKVQACDMLLQWRAHGHHVCTMLDRTLKWRPAQRAPAQASGHGGALSLLNLVHGAGHLGPQPEQ